MGIGVDRLLPFWGKIDCDRYIDHDSPSQPFFPTLYERLFRNKQVINPLDPAFTQDPADLDLDTRDKIAAHRSTIASALGLSAAELDQLLDAPMVSPIMGATEEEYPSWANLSALYRHATLAKGLGLSVRSYLIAVKLAFDPFADTATTVRFVKLVQAISASDLNLIELDYLSCHQILESDRTAPTEAEIGRDLEALRGELHRIFSEHRFVADENPPGGPTVDPDGDLTRSKLALLGWKAELVDELIETLNDMMVYRVKLGPPTQTDAKDFAKTVATLNDDPETYAVSLASLPSSIAVPVDSEKKPLVTHANGKLTASRRLSPEERSTLLQAVKQEDPVKAAVEELIDQQDGYLTTISYDQDRKELCFTGVMRKARKAALLSSPPAPTDPAFQADFETAITNLYKAPRAFLDNAVTSAKDAFLTSAEAKSLLDKPKTPGERFASVLEKLLPYLRETLSERTAIQYLAEALALETETAGDFLKTWLDSPSQQGTSLLEVFRDSTFVESASTSSIKEQGFKDQFDAYLLLHKSALVLSRFECTPRQARWLFTHRAKPKWPDLNALPTEALESPAASLESWVRLVELFEFRDAMARGEEMLDQLLALASAVTTTPAEEDSAKTAYIVALHKWTQWSETDLETLLGDKEDSTALGQIEATFPDDYAGAALLVRLKDCFALLERTGLSAADAVKLSADQLEQAAARAAKEAARSKYDETQWLAIAPPLRNALRERQRAALVAYLLSSPDQDHPWRKISDVYGYFLLDVEMSPCQLTSRVKQAISSVQLFIQRCLMGLEPKVLASAETDNRWREWRWMKNYRVWEANRKIFLYPENWIEPELRDDKTPFFKALEGELLQTNLTKDTAATAFRGYLEKLSDVARLEVVGMYHERSIDSVTQQLVVDQLHVFGRTAGEPHRYYYRRRVRDRYWTCWEQVDLDVEGEHLIPVVWLGRLFLIWPIFTEEVETKNPTLKLDRPLDLTPRKRWKLQLAWSEYTGGKWRPKRISASKYETAYEYAEKHISKECWFFKGLASQSPSRIVVECYVFFGVCWRAQIGPDLSDYDFSGKCKFVLVGSTSDFAVETKEFFYGTISPAPPQGLLVRNMELRECPKADNPLYLPRTFTDTDGAVALAKTSRGTFRLLYAHQCAGFSALRNESWFFNDDLRTYWAVPRVQNVRLKNPDSGAYSMVGAASGFASSFAQNDPFSIVASSNVAKPMINPGDPLLFGDTVPGLARNESYVEFDFSAGTTDLADADAGSVAARHNDYAYRFHLFYHPYVDLFLEALNLYGIDGLLQRSNQLLTDGKLHPNEKNLFTWDYKPKTGPDALVDSKYPIEEVDFSLGNAYSQYNWELFFHAPLLIADSLRRNQRFEDAQRWFHYIFDPTDSSGLPVPDRYWRTKPFYLKTKVDYQIGHVTLLLRALASGGDFDKLQGLAATTKAALESSYEELENAVKEWGEDPFKPHLVARMRTTAYQKTVVMKYLDNLIEWGDQLFRRGTMESINEATQLYVLATDILGKRPDEIPPRALPAVHTYDSIEPLLGEFSNVLVQIEELVPPSALSSTAAHGQQPLPSLTLYFCVPKNDELLAYWDKVADRLFKIRHCMNIEGVEQQLPLFAPPINPALLVKAAAAGLDIGSVLADVSAPLPHYRFQVLAQKTTELCGELKGLGGALISALEKRDAEKLALLRAEQETSLLKLVEAVRKQQMEEADQQIDVLRASREIAATRFDHYRDLLGEEGEILPAPQSSDDSLQTIGDLPISSQAATRKEEGVRLIAHELSGLDSMERAHSSEQTAANLDFIANFLHSLPSIEAKPIGIGAGIYFGHMLSSLSHSYRSIARESSLRAAKSAKLAGLVMRQHGWALQGNQAAKEIGHIDQQIIAAHIRKEIAEQELSNHKKQIDHAEKVESTLRDKYTNEELYSWMVGQISGIYFQCYQLAYDLAKRAERAFRHELGVADSNYIQFGYWDSLKKGLLAGERLNQDLKRMEVAYLDRNRRELEITKHVSLVQLDPVALIQLRETGKCWFEVPEALFDLDYPGHYLRRIKSVSLTVPCVSGPYKGVNCTLTLLGSSIRHSNLLSGGKYTRNLEGDDTRFTDSVGLAQSIVTSRGLDDSGLFETNLRDERFLPFEGAGAISRWQLELPMDFKALDYDTITDVVLHLRYTARSAGGQLKEQTVSELTAAVNAIKQAGDELGLARSFSLRHEFPSAWQAFVTLPQGAKDSQPLKRECTFDTSKERFPYLFQGSIVLGEVQAIFDWDTSTDTAPKPTPPGLALEAGESTATDVCTSENAKSPASVNGILVANWKEPPLKEGKPVLGTWTLAACLTPKQAKALNDILIVCHYTIS